MCPATFVIWIALSPLYIILRITKLIKGFSLEPKSQENDVKEIKREKPSDKKMVREITFRSSNMKEASIDQD